MLWRYVQMQAFFAKPNIPRDFFINLFFFARFWYVTQKDYAINERGSCAAFPFIASQKNSIDFQYRENVTQKDYAINERRSCAAFPFSKPKNFCCVLSANRGNTV